jgi:hypothetical protein
MELRMLCNGRDQGTKHEPDIPNTMFTATGTREVIRKAENISDIESSSNERNKNWIRKPITAVSIQL